MRQIIHKTDDENYTRSKSAPKAPVQTPYRHSPPFAFRTHPPNIYILRKKKLINKKGKEKRSRRLPRNLDLSHLNHLRIRLRKSRPQRPILQIAEVPLKHRVNMQLIAFISRQ